MRLLHTKDLHFEEFFDRRIPQYAILSHRWGEKEVSFQEMSKGRAPEGPGLAKIWECCLLAAERKLHWVWIDTCCIDKKSSAELSEAINSMFRWYEGARECYVYLSDVFGELPPQASDARLAFQEEFMRSKWFTRGWTLQELLAPVQVLFYNHSWTFVGSIDLLRPQIVKATGIRAIFFRKECFMGNYDRACIAEKMSWLSRRETSRVEDMAYCMLGLFGINMPLLYGEGDRAFHRLQLEIIQTSADESIFAWWPPQRDSHSRSFIVRGPILASHPIQFAESGNVRTTVVVFFGRGGLGQRPPYSITNKGLKFRIPPHLSRKMDDHSIAIPLACYRVFHDNCTSVSEFCDTNDDLDSCDIESDDDLDIESDGDSPAIVSDEELDSSECGGGTCKARKELLALLVHKSRDEKNLWHVLVDHNHVRRTRDHNKGDISPFMDIKWPAIYLDLNPRSCVVYDLVAHMWSRTWRQGRYL